MVDDKFCVLVAFVSPVTDDLLLDPDGGVWLEDWAAVAFCTGGGDNGLSEVDGTVAGFGGSAEGFAVVGGIAGFGGGGGAFAKLLPCL